MSGQHTANTTPESERAANTRQRILEAARTEFADSGFGGGRVERIASRAGINKERIYAYFGDKRALFIATIVSAITEVGLTVGQDAEDIVTFAGRVFDFIAEHPQTLRLLTWARLETDPWEEATAQLGDVPLPEDMIARWQRDGEVSPEWDPRDLYVIIWGLCEVWHVPPFRENGSEGVSDGRRRAIVQFIVAVLGEQRELPRHVRGSEGRRDADEG